MTVISPRRVSTWFELVAPRGSCAVAMMEGSSLGMVAEMLLTDNGHHGPLQRVDVTGGHYEVCRCMAVRNRGERRQCWEVPTPALMGLKKAVMGCLVCLAMTGVCF